MKLMADSATGTSARPGRNTGSLMVALEGRWPGRHGGRPRGGPAKGPQVIMPTHRPRGKSTAGALVPSHAPRPPSTMAVMDLPLLAPGPLPGFLSQPEEELRAWLQARGQPPLRARQVRRWLLAGRASSFDRMTDLPRGLREQLAESFSPLGSSIARQSVAADGTRKLLVRLSDGETVECVLLAEADRRTACISTQVGCGMGCVFCASGLEGVKRNLRADEVLEQL